MCARARKAMGSQLQSDDELRPALEATTTPDSRKVQ